MKRFYDFPTPEKNKMFKVIRMVQEERILFLCFQVQFIFHKIENVTGGNYCGLRCVNDFRAAVRYSSFDHHFMVLAYLLATFHVTPNKFVFIKYLVEISTQL